jgi:hypothetical protein
MARVRWILAGLVAVIDPAVTTLAAQCAPAAISTPTFVVRDSVGGCRTFPLNSFGQVTQKVRIRRSAVTHVLLVQHLFDRTIPEVSRGTTKGENAGTTPNGIGFKEFDLTLPASDPLGDLTISFKGVLAELKVTATADRRGEITGFAQTPAQPKWGVPVRVTMTGRDIGNAAVEVAQHSITNLNSTNTTLSFDAVATGSMAKQTVGVVVWDKANSKSLGTYLRPGQQQPALSYLAEAGTASCTTVPGLPGPTLSAPLNGATRQFNSPTDPVKDRVTFKWSPIPDPEKKYVLRIEKYLMTTSTGGGLTGGKTGSVSVAPLTVSEYLVTAGTGTVVSAIYDLERNRQYKWKVRGSNCGATTATWSLTYSLTVK